MDFRFEGEMVAPTKMWLQSKHAFVKEEFRLPWGYCDLVGCSLNPTRVRQRLQFQQRQPIGSLIRVDILWRIPDEGSVKIMTLDKLTEVYDHLLNRTRLEEELRVLEERNFVLRKGREGFQKLNGWFPLHRSLVAVELKLIRVDEAIRQAQAHLSFADKAYVGLPLPLALRVARSARRQDFLQEGVGLLGVTEAECRVLIASKAQKRKDTVLQAYCVERFWRYSLKGN